MELVAKSTKIDPDSVRVDDNKISFNITKCLWADMFKSMDAAEIGHAWSCATDFTRAKTWSSRLELTRTQTIMEGAPHCDYCFTWQE